MQYLIRLNFVPVLRKVVMIPARAIAVGHLLVCIKESGYWTVSQAGSMVVETLEVLEFIHEFHTKKFLTGFKE